MIIFLHWWPKVHDPDPWPKKNKKNTWEVEWSSRTLSLHLFFPTGPERGLKLPNGLIFFWTQQKLKMTTKSKHSKCKSPAGSISLWWTCTWNRSGIIPKYYGSGKQINNNTLKMNECPLKRDQFKRKFHLPTISVLGDILIFRKVILVIIIR